MIKNDVVLESEAGKILKAMMYFNIKVINQCKLNTNQFLEQ